MFNADTAIKTVRTLNVWCIKGAMNNMRIEINPFSQNADEPTLNDTPYTDVATGSVFRRLTIGLYERL